MSNVVALRPARGRWIPWIFVGGMLVVIAVNGVLIGYAIASFPGLADPEAYEHGVRYNAVLAEVERQERLGWRLAARLDDAGEVIVRAQGRDGAALEGLSVVARLTRPVDAPATVDAQLAPAGAGVYRARVALPRVGQWELHVTASAGDDRVDLRQRVVAR